MHVNNPDLDCETIRSVETLTPAPRSLWGNHELGRGHGPISWDQ